MSGKKGLLLFFLTALVIMVCSSQVLAAWGRNGKGRADRPGLAALLAKKLDLTQDQIAKLKALLTPEQKEKFKGVLDKKGGRMPLGLGGNRH